MTVSTASRNRKQIPGMLAPSDTQARRVLALSRAYQRALAHKPTLIQKTLIDRAAVLTAKAEAAALNPATTANDVVRLDHAAARARAEMFTMFTGKQAPDDGASDLDRYLQQRAAESGGAA